MTKYTIEVAAVIGGTIINDEYLCDRASINMRTENSPYATVIIFKNGEDSNGPVESVLYHKVERIIKRPNQQDKCTAQTFSGNMIVFCELDSGHVGSHNYTGDNEIISWED